MNKIKNALWCLGVSILFILLSMESVTGTGILEMECDCFQTISPMGKYFTWTYEELNVAENMGYSWILRILFVVGMLLIYVSNFFLDFESKVKRIALIIVNTVGMGVILLLFSMREYMFMLIVVNVLLFLNVLLQYIKNYRSKSELPTLISSALVTIMNIFFLFLHWIKRYEFIELMDSWHDRAILVEKMVSISRVNMICFILWGIPLIMLLLQCHKVNKKLHA